jgi:type I restriction-modification system DNA methylase subunit
MLNEKQVKNNIRKLIDDFNANYQQYKRESEASVETKLIEPLFKLLGWTEKDFRKQEKAGRDGRTGHADYAFYLEDKIVFFLEVKRVGIPLEKEADKQVISYALSKRVPFAVSTNFEELKIFCVEQENAINNIFRAVKQPADYVNNFQDISFLSKESFEQGLTLKKAESEGRLKRRVSIDRSLLEDLMHMRSLIASDIEKSYPGKYEINEKDEIIQRIIDRLIFIRRCEDTGINPENLTLKEVQNLPENKAYPKLKEIFKRYNDVYNSGLFAIAKDNDCDKITINGVIIKKLAQYLYESKDEKYIYNFDWIDADVLGQVYEQYLGKLLSQTKSGKAKLTNGQAHRKEQGIYYTPTYIVDYIVKNTVGELVKNKKIRAKDLKILDPACGSGSFLIKAFDYLYNNLSSSKDSKQYRIDSQGKYSIKTEILKNNIYGVDLDQKAVEITKLNLLLKAAEKNRRLPEEIDVHIKHGNSLIDDETFAGLDAFRWEEKFKEIMDKGGFDVVIGNPPYVRNTELPDHDKEFFTKKYSSAYKQYDIYLLFFEIGLKLLKNKGYLGFITSNKFIASEYGQKLRDLILKQSRVVLLIDVSNLRIFKDASTYPVITILQKTKEEVYRKNNKIFFQKIEDISDLYSNKNITVIKQSKFMENEDNQLLEHKGNKKSDLIKKIEKNCFKIKNLFLCQRGSPKNKIKIFDSKTRESLSCIISRDVNRYCPKVSEKIFVISDLQNKIISKEKILLPRTVLSLKAAYETGNNFIMDRIYYLIPKDEIKINLKFVTGILNSKLMDFYYKIGFGTTHVGGGYLDLRGIQIVELPIKQIPESQQQPLIRLVDKMIYLNKRSNEIGDKKTSESAKIEEEIRNTDNQIDELVYKLYGLTKEEITIVEKSLKD